MSKHLGEMTNEELWALFPIVLTEYNPDWPLWYVEERERIVNALGEDVIFRVHHYGSTSVPDLTAKPTVDILLEIREDTDIDSLIRTLEQTGYITSPQPNNPPPHLLLMKGYTPAGFAEKVFHLHVRYPGDWDELYFRDWLREHPETAEEYIALKLSLKDRFRHNRDGYTEAKGMFIRAVTGNARARYDGRYQVSHENAIKKEYCDEGFSN